MHTLTKTKTDYTQAVNRVVSDFLVRQQASARLASPYYEDLWKEIERLVGSGGKRFRPRLSILAYRAFGGTEVEAILPAVAAQELLHLSMLVHDDIIDRDYVRYGVDNIAGGYRKRYQSLVEADHDATHYANMAALLAGDLLLSSVYQLSAEAAIPPARILAIQKLLGRAIFEVAGGELLDTEAAFRVSGQITTEAVALHKTASYTFVLPMLVGALLAELPKRELVHVQMFGRHLGIAFQLRDDIIGIFGDEQATGKSTIGDIREGKRTYMIEQFYKLATDDQRQTFEQYFGRPSLTADQAETVRKLLRASGAFNLTEQAIAEYETKARAALAKLSIRPECVDELEDLILVATQRQA